MMNIHCQPASPSNPWTCRMSPDTGLPTSDDSGEATMNQANTRARYCTGNHSPR